MGWIIAGLVLIVLLVIVGVPNIRKFIFAGRAQATKAADAAVSADIKAGLRQANIDDEQQVARDVATLSQMTGKMQVINGDINRATNRQIELEKAMELIAGDIAGIEEQIAAAEGPRSEQLQAKLEDKTAAFEALAGEKATVDEQLNGLRSAYDGVMPELQAARRRIEEAKKKVRLNAQAEQLLTVQLETAQMGANLNSGVRGLGAVGQQSTSFDAMARRAQEAVETAKAQAEFGRPERKVDDTIQDALSRVRGTATSDALAAYKAKAAASKGNASASNAGSPASATTGSK